MNDLKDEEIKEANEQLINTVENEILNSGRSYKIDSPIEEPTATGNGKKIRTLLKGYKWVLLGISVIIVVFAILLFVFDFDLKGIGTIAPELYVTPSCGKVYLTKEKESYTNTHKNDPDYKPITNPSLVDLESEEGKDRFEFEEYSYDEYITNIVWQENQAAYDVDNEIVYQAMAIMARTKFFKNFSDNCVVLKEYDETAKLFVKLEGTEEKYTEIKDAVTKTQGIVLVKEGQLINVQHDIFSYTKKMKDEEEYKDQYYYHMMNVNEKGEQIIPASWINKIEEEKKETLVKKVSTTTKLSSFSLYGAKYLLEKADSQYELYRILEEYFGRDLEYKTIDSNAAFDKNTSISYPDISFQLPSSGKSCMWWPIGSDEITLENGVEVAKGEPKTTTITSPFGPRKAPTAGASTYHNSIDIARNVVEGQTNIIAADSGTVTKVITGCVRGSSESNKNCGGGLGNAVYIDHGNGIETRYGHLYSVTVTKGQKVQKGQVIGKIGSTGVSTGVHLDFRVDENGKSVNPLYYVSQTNNRAVCSYKPSGDNKSSVCQLFLNAGFTPAQVAGIMVNVNGESGFSPSAFNPAGGGIGAYGLFQWRGNRQRALKLLNNYDQIDVQVSFALNELNSSELNAKNKLLATNTPQDASYNFCVYYERPGLNMEEIKKACQGRKTTSLTTQFYNYANNGCS